MAIKRPNIVKVFAGESTFGNYLPVKFGTNIPASKTNYDEVANANYEYGLESLEGDLQLKDLNSVFFYQSKLLQYLFQQGVPEFSAYQDYPSGSLVSYDSGLWIAMKDIKASLKEPTKVQVDPCNPCSIVDADEASKVCQQPTNPSVVNGWCQLVTHCEIDYVIEQLQQTDKLLQESIGNLKGVTSFSISNNEDGVPELTLGLSGDSTVTIPMTKFGSAKQLDNGDISVVNPDGSKVLIKAHRATTKVIDTKGDTLGFVHADVYPEDITTFTKTITLVSSDALDDSKGFYWNTNTHKWEVDLTDLLQSGSGLVVDRNGNISIDPEYTTARDTKAKELADSAKASANTYADNKLSELEAKGAKVYVNKPITGNGLKTNPLGLNLGDDFRVDANGKLALADNAPTNITNLQSGYKYGFHTFTGSINKATGKYVWGFPSNFSSQVDSQEMTTEVSQLVDGESYDFNGYYIASGNQLDIQVSNGSDVWSIVNESGVNADGTLKGNSWTHWQKLDNARSVADRLIESLQNQVNSLGTQLSTATNRITALETKNDETCKVPISTYGSHTLVDTDNTIICTGGTITVPTGLHVGRMFTIIQSSTDKVTITGSEMTVHAPYEGSLVLAGQNSAVTILIDSNSSARVFGQTETV